MFDFLCHFLVQCGFVKVLKASSQIFLYQKKLFCFTTRKLAQLCSYHNWRNSQKSSHPTPEYVLYMYEYVYSFKWIKFNPIKRWHQAGLLDGVFKVFHRLAGSPHQGQDAIQAYATFSRGIHRKNAHKHTSERSTLSRMHALLEKLVEVFH